MDRLNDYRANAEQSCGHRRTKASVNGIVAGDSGYDPGGGNSRRSSRINDTQSLGRRQLGQMARWTADPGTTNNSERLFGACPVPLALLSAAFSFPVPSGTSITPALACALPRCPHIAAHADQQKNRQYHTKDGNDVSQYSTDRNALDRSVPDGKQQYGQDNDRQCNQARNASQSRSSVHGIRYPATKRILSAYALVGSPNPL